MTVIMVPNSQGGRKIQWDNVVHTHIAECLVIEEGSVEENSGAGEGLNKARHDRNWLRRMTRVPPR